MGWTGSITVNVNNQTGGQITNVNVSHTWSGNTQSPGQNLTIAANNQPQVSFTASTGSGSSDEWSVQFNDASNNCWFRNDKQCDIEQEDVTAPNAVINFNLGPGTQGFSIDLPVSSSCSDNDYDSC